MSAVETGNKPVRVFISQQDNYAANFGEVLRSSAIFWAKNNALIKTTIGITNYWKYKNGTEVNVLVNLRDSAGRLIQRTKVDFGAAEVFNYCPPADFDGSIEVEAFSAKNLRIPYAAVMAVYECADSITMVHSYARAYSQHEIEDKRTICIGEESCWSIYETETLMSFCAFHNGPGRIEEQRVTLGIRKADGVERVVNFVLPGLAPFQTVVIEPRKYIPDIVAWLGGLPGNGRISFRLEGGFTRFLCGVRTIDWSQLQVTHSNFNYSVHETDNVQGENSTAYMVTPTVQDGGVKQEVVIYPDNSPGEYAMKGGGFEQRFKTTQIVRKEYETNKGVRIEFFRDDGTLPSRIVTGFRLRGSPSTIAAECSLGVVHHKRPPKHFSWMIVSREFNSTVCWVDLSEVYGGCPPHAKLVFKFYSAESQQPFIKEMEFSQLPADGNISLAKIFDDQTNWSGAYGYLTVRCSYGGLGFFSTLHKKRSISIEHSF